MFDNIHGTAFLESVHIVDKSLDDAMKDRTS